MTCYDELVSNSAAGFIMVLVRMSRLPHLAIFSFAAVHLLLFSICPVASRIYRTNDAVVIEVDDVVKPASAFANRNFGNPPPIPMMYAVNPVFPYTGGLSYQQQPNFLFWPYPLYRPANSLFSADDVEKVAATYSPESKQQNIACGKGPPSLPQRQTPAVRVIGGTNVTQNSWPFMVGLKTSSRFPTFCGGTLISTTKILTAASCVNKFSAFDISAMTASFGMISQLGGNAIDAAQQVRRVTRVVYHLDYNDKTKQNDIAVLTIDPPITYSSAISPVCLPKSNTNVNQFAGQNAGILGWGFSSTSSSPLPLQQATVQVIANADCNASYKTANTSITAKQFCTAANTDGAIASACQFDNGGPLVTQNQQTSDWTQAGVYSFGSGCTNPATPSVYTSVAYFRNWIDNYMKN